MPLNLLNLILTFNTALIFILFISIFFFQTPFTPTNINPRNNTSALGILNNETFFHTTKNNSFFVLLLKTIAFISIIPLTISTFLNFPDIVICFDNWLLLNAFSINLEFHYDFRFNIFFSIALIVSSSIIEFSHYYMETDPNKNNFFRLLIIFLLNMIILTSTNNIFLLFIGWEGVGFLSFLLISWWQTRSNANNAAMQAIVYNRIGDIGLLLFFALIAINFNTWSLSDTSSLDPDHPSMILALIGILVAAAGKSAQFGLHPWLPAAMEGPTPVSALLHSSTMVVAGIFLLIRISHIYSSFPAFNNWCLILGSLTALFAATTAISQHDIKKIIAYSTTSQLGLMMVAIGLNQPNIALFHICTHAFFKAMLFLSSGSIIHSLNDEQDLRKMGGIYFILPNTSACILLGSLALAGTPFLAGFYSKDLILETSLVSFSNLMGISLSLVATLLTAVYSIRIAFFCFIAPPAYSPLSPTSEENPSLINALNRLALGTILSGWFITTFMLFIFPLNIILLLKFLALIVSISGLVYSLQIIQSFSLSHLHSNLGLVNNFYTSQWFYEKLFHILLTFSSFYSSLFFSTRNIDQGWNENVGAQGASYTTLSLSQSYQYTQTGYIKHYLVMSSVLFALLLSITYILS
nr:NADH dehydrogenase subunit 5 [Paulasterias sp. SS-2022]